jgi:integrase
LADTLVALHKLNQKDVDKATKGTRAGDGGGLWLWDVAWTFRFKSPVTGKERFMGLGPVTDVSLATARTEAGKLRELLRRKIDPIEHKRAAAAEAVVKANRGTTFKAFAQRYVEMHKTGWKNAKHAQQWANTLATYVYPVFGDTPVADVTTEQVLDVLRPIWLTKKETAARIRGRLEMIFGAAIHGATKVRTAENPALLATLKHSLPAQKRKATRKHFPALPWKEMPAFWASLSEDRSDAAHLLRWIILTLPRYHVSVPFDGEIKKDTWTITAARMKVEKDFEVPLSKSALALLPVPHVSGTALTSCIRRHTKSPATTHGMRSTFRDWAGDNTDHPRELAEMALAHAVGNEVELAYRRGQALEKRRALMTAWAAYCESKVR